MFFKDWLALPRPPAPPPPSIRRWCSFFLFLVRQDKRVSFFLFFSYRMFVVGGCPLPTFGQNTWLHSSARELVFSPRGLMEFVEYCQALTVRRG